MTWDRRRRASARPHLRAAVAAGVVVCALVTGYVRWERAHDHTDTPMGVGSPVASDRPAEAGPGLAGAGLPDRAVDLSWASPPVVAIDVPGRPRTAASHYVEPVSDDSRLVALTIDDNYAPEKALPVLQALAKVRAPATVFLTGGPTRSYPEVTASIARSPLLEVADHAGTHTELTGRTRSALEDEVGSGVAAFREMTGRHTSRLFRPPGGHYDDQVLQVAGEKGFPWTIGFSPGPADWEGPPAREMLHKIVSGEVTPGSLVLLHFNAEHTAELIPELVGALRARGYRLVTVSQLLKGSELYLDLRSGDPGYEQALLLDRADIVNGYPTGDYGVWEPMSRVDLAWALAKLLRPTEAGSGRAPGINFADVRPAETAPGTPLADVSAEQKAAIDACVASGLMQGDVDADGRPIFRPWASVRRADLALVLARASGSTAHRPLTAGTSKDLLPQEPVGRLEVARTLYRLAEELRPQLVGTEEMPEW